MRYRRFALIVCALALLAGPTARAQSEAPVDPVQQLYQEALLSIAEGRKNDANNALQRVIEQEPLHAGAWLDLALIQCALGRREEAETMFRTIEERFKPPQGILDLINDARKEGCSQWTPLSQYSITVSRGIDQNVNQGSSREIPVSEGYDLSPEFRPQHDQYSVISADYARDLTPNGTLGFAQVQQRRNDSLRQYDSAAVLFGVETPWRYKRWTLRTTALAGYVTLGSQFYQRQYQVQARLGPPLTLPYRVEFHLLGSINRLSYVTLENFNSTTFEVRPQFSRRTADGVISASAGLLTDHASGDRPGGDRHGASASLQWRRQYAWGLNTELAYNGVHWRSSTEYAPGVINEVRDQTTHTLRATFSYPVAKNHSVQLELRAVKNQENIPVFQYNNRQMQLSWQWQGP